MPSVSAWQNNPRKFPRSFHLLCIPPQDSRQYFYVLLASLMSKVKTRLEVKLEQHREEWDNPFPQQTLNSKLQILGSGPLTFFLVA